MSFISQDYEPRYSIFHDLMKHRVREILLVSSLYEAFVLEEDGRLSDRLFDRYVEMQLRYIPRITRVSSAEYAFRAMEERTFDLIIIMARLSDMDPFEFGRCIKERYPGKPVILLSIEPVDQQVLERARQEKTINKVFYWTGDSRILLAIVKYVEDLFNIQEDIRLGVQVVLVIEDSPAYYSIFLPIIYTEIMSQTRELISDSINDTHRLLRMRTRPKILLAETYEQGLEHLQAYEHNLLGLICDIRFPRNGEEDPQAGFDFADKAKQAIPDLPILLQSAELKNREWAYERGFGFLNKNSQNLLLELREFILHNLGFGDFVFRLPDGTELARASNLREMASVVRTIDSRSLEYHITRNHISIWCRARTEFELAEELRPKQKSDFGDLDEVREFIVSRIEKILNYEQAGVIRDFTVFSGSDITPDKMFIRLGAGSLGGKGRGIAFMNALLTREKMIDRYEDVEIRIPNTFVICSEVFEDFVKTNDLQERVIQAKNDEAVARLFRSMPLPRSIVNDLRTMLTQTHYPLAVRSSSFLEDSKMLPFAGLYKTFMLPNNHPAMEVRLRQLSDAIRLVYASIFFRSPKEYVRNVNFRIEDEKMAVVIQQIAGQPHGNRFYPVISGVGQSYNFYPFSYMKPQHGIVALALGLGKYIVEGGKAYQYSPAFPKLNPPFKTPLEFVDNSQRDFFALDLSDPNIRVDHDETFSLDKHDLAVAEDDGVLSFVGSTYSGEDDAIRDTLLLPGPRVVTFANLLKHNSRPLNQIVVDMMKLGSDSFGMPVEIEFAMNMFREKERKDEFFFLQIRPMSASAKYSEVSVDDIAASDTICISPQTMGNGIFTGLYDFVYLDPDTFDVARSLEIADEVGRLNQELIRENRRYILLGFGRWATADRWLGIPVQWHQISNAQVFIESTTPRLRTEPSQGSHFFQNMLSLGIGYFYVPYNNKAARIDWDWLQRQPLERKTSHVRHVRTERPMIIKLDGRSSRGVILKPDSA